MKITINLHAVKLSKDYREILKNEYQKRKMRNANYSLRAFARDIGLTSPRLTDVLKNRQGLSRLTAATIAQKLGFIGSQAEFFCNAVEALDGRSQTSRDLAKRQIEKFGNLFKRKVKDDQFKIISDWYHFAILSMSNIADFKSSPEWIAKKLGLSVPVVEKAIERLLNLGYLVDKNGKLSESENLVACQDEIPSKYGRSFHKQIIIKALESIETQSMHQRDITSMTLAVNPSKIPLAKKMIADFIKEFDKEMNDVTDLEKLYAISIQFFSLEKDS
ncbi:MAG: TIGR02147 family protein [Bdellovibrionaceae bacterium]|nr:TIGR02147 family protein [Pseudobdellovibrionaceae bacterium]